jgi:hypothetical protein
MGTTTTFIGDAPVAGLSTVSLAAYNQAATHCIVVGVTWFNVAPTKVEDTAGNNYVKVPWITIAGTVPITFWYAKNCLGNAANVIKVTFAGIGILEAVFGWDVAGADTLNPLANSAQASGSSTTPTSETFNTSVANSSIIFLTESQVGFITASLPVIGGTSVSLDGQTGQGGNLAAGAHLDVTSLQTSITTSCTISPSTSWDIAAVVISGQHDASKPYCVQYNYQIDSGGSTQNTPSLAYPSNCTQGNLLFVTCGWLSNTNTPTIADTLSNSWVGLPIQTANNCKVKSWYCLNCVSTGANTITVTFASGTTNFVALSIDEWSPAGGSPFILDAHAEGTDTATKTISTTGNRDVIFGYQSRGYIQYSGDVGWSMRSYGPHFNAVTFLEDQLSLASGSVSYVPHTGGANAGSAGIAAFFSSFSGVPNSLMMMGCGT